MPTKDPNAGVAFALVTAAGMATALGGAIVFSPTLAKYASRRTLAAALGLSAGVMTYLSLVKIFQKSNNSFLDAGHAEGDAYVYATLCFFAGVIFTIVSAHRDLNSNQTVHSTLDNQILSGSVLCGLQTFAFGRTVFVSLFRFPHFILIS
jgi:ZIP family zinc transporter